MRRLDGNATPEVPTFGPTSGGISGAVGIVCGLGLAASTLSEGVHPSELPYLFAGLAFVAASWALLLRPRIRLHPRDLELRNAFSSFRIPYAAISGVSVRSYTVVRVGERRYVGLAVGRTRGSMTRRRRGELLGQAPDLAKGKSLVGVKEADLLQSMLDDRVGGTEDVAPGRVVRRWAVPEIAAVAGCLLAFVLSIALR